MRKVYVLLTTFMLLCTVAMAQTVTGVITDENNDPMYGVNVIEKGTTNGMTTGFDGKYSLKLSSESAIIVFKFLGYRDHEVAYAGKSINHKMQEDQIGLDQVVVSASKRKERLLDAPASVTVLNAEKIENTAAVSVTDNLKGIAGVDVMPTGLVSQNVSVRGFNNIFSTGMLTLVDNRIGSVPSLKVNAFQLIPTNNSDIEKIEVVRGPGSALYGPNASDGVLHIITKSPLAMEPDHNAETTIGITFGSRSVWNPEFRHAQKVSDKFGFKISGGYMQGHDFEYTDPGEPTWGDEFYTVATVGGNSLDTLSTGNTFARNFFIQKYNADARFDFAINKDFDITLNGGYTNTTNLELTGLGAAQGDGWGYTYAQTRIRYKKLFINYFLNASNSGDTYIISRVDPSAQGPHQFTGLLDKSKMHGLQLQHSSEIKDKWNFIYGADALLTRPNSDGTIYGVYEDESQINQVGVYGQAEWDVSKKFTLLAALRGDYQTPINEFNISPRAAIVYKPTPRNTLRATFNRAFSTPSALNLALDLPQTFVPNGIIGKGFGNPNGFDFRRNDQGLPMYLSPYDQQWYDVNDNSRNFANFNNTLNSIGEVLGESLAGNAALGGLLLTPLLNGLDSTAIANTPVIVTDFNTGRVIEDLTTIQDQESVKSTITQTIELGYKGLIADKLFLAVDGYFTNISNFTSPLTAGSYRVQFDPNALQTYLAPLLAGNLAGPSSLSPGSTLEQSLIDFTINPETGFSALDANKDGSIVQEVIGLLTGDPNDAETNGLIYDFSSGTVAPDDERVGDDLILTYVNYGKVNVWGADFSAKYQINKDVAVSGAFSFVNKDRFELKGDDAPAGQFVYLNAPRFKSSVNVSVKEIAKTGLGAGVSWSWQDAYRAESAIFVGNVNAANLIDVNLSYRPKFSEGTVITANLNNIANYKFQRFPGTPAIGFFAMFKLAHTFNYNIGKKKTTTD